MKRFFFIFPLFLLALLCLPCKMSAQSSSIRGFNEVSATIGVGSNVGGSATPNYSVLYTRGLHFGDYFSAGLSAGYDYGLSAQLLLRGNLPFGKDARTGAYLSGQGGAGFLMNGTIPILSVSTGIFHRFKNDTQLIVGPMVKWGYMEVDSVENDKAWGGAFGLRLGFMF